MSEYVLAALALGFMAGLSPGPLSVIVIQQTIAHGFVSGAKASLAPILTDGPIILIALLLLIHFKENTPLIAFLSFVGGIYLIWLASKVLHAGEINILSEKLPADGSLRLAIKVNLLNPSPYIFWSTVGGAYILLGSAPQALIFVVLSISALVLSKMLIAAIAAWFHPFLESRGYLLVMKALAALLIVFGGTLLTQRLPAYSRLVERYTALGGRSARLAGRIPVALQRTRVTLGVCALPALPCERQEKAWSDMSLCLPAHL